MIVAIGVDVDYTFVRFVAKAIEAGVPIRAVNLRAAVEGEWLFEAPARGPAMLGLAEEQIELSCEDAYYCRLIDLSSKAPSIELGQRWRGLLGGLRAWLDTVPGKVVNRGNGAAHNGSKPLHEATLVDLGFRVPESITSCDKEDLLAFVREGAVISKALCGIRADTAAVAESDFDTFEPAAGPVHLQRLISGADARIHVIGDRLIAQQVSGTTIDYRREGTLGEMALFDPPGEIRDLLIKGTRAIGLELAGWDFKIDREGVFWCLEANPMPGYSPYDALCDGAITRELLGYLQNGANGC